MMEQYQTDSNGHANVRGAWSYKQVCVVLGVFLLSACAQDRPMQKLDVMAPVRADLEKSAAKAPVAVPSQVSDALAEPALKVTPVPEARLDLLVSDANARDVFLAIVADTRYSMLMHPDVTGKLSVTLRGVTVTEALEAIRDVYGYDFKMEGRRITIYAPTLQTRVFTLNYPNSQRTGSSELRVSSGGGLQTATSGGATTTAAAPAAANNQQNLGSQVSTTSKTDLWTELTTAARAMVGDGAGRSVITSPQAGIMAVRAMPEELRQVERFLKAAQIAVQRQVMLEAKVIEVELREGFQSGVNWAAFAADGNNTLVAGVLGTGVTATNPLLQGGSTVISNVVPSPSVATGGGLFGLALSTNSFGAVIGFLESQGDVQTLSSPRVATLNNQKAVLKVGTDEFFVTNVTGGTAATTTTAATMPNLTLTPLFSGISLDVTPQIDEGTNVTLHVHPSLSSVSEKTKQVDLGSSGNFKLPLASTSVNETDTLVRIQDGSIVAIGGLMQMDSSRASSGLPGATGSTLMASLFGNRSSGNRKKEVIVLIKPTIIRTAEDWEAQNRRSRAALDDMDATRARIIRLDGSTQ
jgi:MSHA biogenesis protein MshL